MLRFNKKNILSYLLGKTILKKIIFTMIVALYKNGSEVKIWLLLYDFAIVFRVSLSAMHTIDETLNNL